MKLTTLLQKMGLIHGGEPDPQPAGTPAPVQEEARRTQVLSLVDLRARAREASSQAEAAELGLHKSFEEIYRDAGIGEPPGGVSLEELDRLIQGVPVEEARRRILEALRDKGAPLEQVLRDGLHRDQALDAFEIEVTARVAVWGDALQEKAEALLREAADLERQARELKARVSEVRQALEEWKRRKHEEEDLMEVLGQMLVDQVDRSEGGS